MTKTTVYKPKKGGFTLDDKKYTNPYSSTKSEKPKSGKPKKK